MHDVVPGDRPVTAGLVLVEGNWLLLDEPGWRDLATHSAYNVFLEADPALLRDRLIDRKVRGGLTRAAAVDFYERSDRLNVERVLTGTDRSKVDLLLHLNADGTTERRRLTVTTADQPTPTEQTTGDEQPGARPGVRRLPDRDGHPQRRGVHRLGPAHRPVHPDRAGCPTRTWPSPSGR